MNENSVVVAKGCLSAKDIQKITGFQKAKAQRLFRTLREAKRRQLDRDFPDRAIKEPYVFPEDVAANMGMTVPAVERRLV
ncbi:hypothetical protein [Spirosoma pomorum]